MVIDVEEGTLCFTSEGLDEWRVLSRMAAKYQHGQLSTCERNFTVNAKVDVDKIKETHEDTAPEGPISVTINV